MNISITPQKEVYHVGDVLTCLADALPIADYTWTNLRNLEKFIDVHIKFPEHWAGTNQILKCDAHNVIENTHKTVTAEINVYIPCKYIYKYILIYILPSSMVFLRNTLLCV